MVNHDVIPRVVSEAAIDWVKFDALLARDGSVEPVDKALYAAIASFADQGTRETEDALDADDIPTRKVLARCIGRSVDTVDRATKRLEDKGLLDVERRPDPNNPRVNIPSIYRLLDHERWDERAAVRAEKRQAERDLRSAARKAKQQAREGEGGGRTSAATPGEGVAALVRPGGPHGRGQGGRTSAAVPSSLQESLSRGGCA
ncbi:helix-turn-helix domain-containing protein [Streptomyces sp. 4.24]|uniref:helix-turn-helix domain-containing protein n=1 Tax=Streptomyces tritrimontium TaxID=3406573 RepID=UPI003BB4F9D0